MPIRIFLHWSGENIPGYFKTSDPLYFLFPTFEYKVWTAQKQDKILILHWLLEADEILSMGESDDYERYAKMGLQIDPKFPFFLSRHGLPWKL